MHKADLKPYSGIDHNYGDFIEIIIGTSTLCFLKVLCRYIVRIPDITLNHNIQPNEPFVIVSVLWAARFIYTQFGLWKEGSWFNPMFDYHLSTKLQLDVSFQTIAFPVRGRFCIYALSFSCLFCLSVCLCLCHRGYIN